MELNPKERSDLMDNLLEAHGSTIDRAVRIWKMHRIPFILSLVSLVSIIIAIVLVVRSTQSTSPILFSEGTHSSASISAQTKGILVDIEGAVVNPGVYEIPIGSRIDDILQKAGGLRKDADVSLITKTINRASRLVDGAKIYIPKIGENIIEQNIGTQGQTSTGVSAVGLISVNTASQAELEVLPGIGPVTATKIISNRSYQTLEELVTKKAMSQSLFNKLKEQLSL